MLNLTPKQLISIVPLQENFKQNLLASYDSYTDAEKYELLNILWDAFEDMKTALRAIIHNQVEKEIGEKVLPFGTSVEAEVTKRFDTVLQDRLTGKYQDEEKLEHIRSHLSSLINTLDKKQQ